MYVYVYVRNVLFCDQILLPDAHCANETTSFGWQDVTVLSELHYNKAASEFGTETVKSAGLLKVTRGI